jgi:hypothetical protein
MYSHIETQNENTNKKWDKLPINTKEVSGKTGQI